MYNTQIQTTLSIMGHLVFIEYTVTEEWAVEWYVNMGAYHIANATTSMGLDLMELLLRTNHAEKIEQQLFSEFEHRQYEEEQKVIALAEQEDIPF